MNAALKAERAAAEEKASADIAAAVAEARRQKRSQW